VTHLTLSNFECFRNDKSIISVIIREETEFEEDNHIYTNISEFEWYSIEKIYGKSGLKKLIENTIPPTVKYLKFVTKDKTMKKMIKKIVPENINLSFK